MKQFVSALFLLVVAFNALPAAAAPTAEGASAFVDGVARQALAVINNQGLGKEQKRTQLEGLFSGSVDIPWVGRFVLGRFWRDATEAQRQRYLSEYGKFITANYAGRFAEYTGGSYTIKGATDDGDGKFTVTMQMTSPDNQQVLVNYRLHNAEKGGLKIFDVVVEGVSLLTTQRSEFAQVLGSKGLDELISQLANRTAPGGAVSAGDKVAGKQS